MLLGPFTLSARTRRDLGFDELEAILLGIARSAFGREALQRDVFPESSEVVRERLDDADEGRRLAELGVAPPFAELKDVRPVLSLVAKSGVLGPSDLVDIAGTLSALARVREYIESRGDEFPRLLQHAHRLADEREFARRVQAAFDEEGRLTDEASPALKELRDRVRALRADAKVILDGLIADLDDRELLRDRNFTVRHDRYVLPVKSEHQGLIEGIVHDASQTGQTVFIEPRATMHLGNRITIAQAAVKEEEERILVELTDEVRARRARLLEDLKVAGSLEATWVRGMFASRIQAVRPHLLDDGAPTALDLRRARHPLLSYQRAQATAGGKRPAPVVGNDIGFAGRRALVITGPNAGGKTVALKTAGLLSLMARSGLPIPADEGSKLPIYRAVLATVGDEQDLSRDLSSFSGHLEALARILEDTSSVASRGPVLALLDELCAGTAPDQGTALAQATLEALAARGAAVVATTHFERLKTLALSDEETFRNASVGTDPDGRPTFRVHLDSFGSSNAFDAARRHGLPAEVLDRAEQLADPAGREVGDLLARLTDQNAALEAEREQLDARRRQLEAQNDKLNLRLREVNDEADRLRREGAKAFLGELKDARRQVAEAIEAARRGADARTLNQLSHSLRDEEASVSARLEAAQADDPPADGPLLTAVKKGDRVHVVSLPGTVLEVLEVNGDDVVVGRGAMRLKKPLRELRAANAEQRAPGREKKKRQATSSSSEPRTRDNTLDLRGNRVEEGLELMDAFLDKLLRDGKGRAFILHGHGTGAMKKAVRDAARASRYVARSGPAEREDGGDAITIIDLGDPA